MLLENRDLVDGVLKDFRTAPISEPERLLFGFLDRLTRDERSLTHEDVDRLKTAGWSEEAIYDAITVCALFNFYNRWIDGTGVADMPAAAYQASGQRLATQGYVSGEQGEARSEK
jgi:alkylhydroperoxidase family enzyme